MRHGYSVDRTIDARHAEASAIGPRTSLPADLQHHLQQSRDSLPRGLEDLSEYDARRPVMPSGTNLLGLVKHLAGVIPGQL